MLLFSGTINHFKALMIKRHGTLRAAVLWCLSSFFPSKCLRKTLPNKSTVWGNHVLKARRNKDAMSCKTARRLRTHPRRPAEIPSRVCWNVLINLNHSMFGLTWQPPLKQAMSMDDHSATEARRDYFFLVQPAATRQQHPQKKQNWSYPQRRWCKAVRRHLWPSLAAGSQNCFKPWTAKSFLQRKKKCCLDHLFYFAVLFYAKH